MRQAFREEGEQEQARAELGTLLVQALRSTASDPAKHRAVGAYQKALEDREFGIDHVRRVLTAERPLSEYSTVKEDMTEGRVRQEYMIATRRTELTGVEERLIALVGRRQHIRQTDMPHVVNALVNAARLSEGASEYLQQLSERVDELMGQGVTRELLEEVRRSVSVAHTMLLREEEQRRGIDLAGNYVGLVRRTREAEARIDLAKQKVSRAIAAHKIGVIVDDVYGEEIQEGYGLHARRIVIEYILSGVSASAFDESTVRQRISQLRSLDPALQAEVLQGTRRLEHALRLQAERNKPVVPEQAQIERPVQGPPSDETPIARPDDQVDRKPAVRSATSALPQIPQTPITPAPQVRTDVFVAEQITERRRREIHNANAIRLAREGRMSLRGIDLSPEELTTEAREELSTYFNEMGNLLFGHPNSARIVQDYIRRVQEELREQQARLKQELDSTIKETRTGQ